MDKKTISSLIEKIACSKKGGMVMLLHILVELSFTLVC